MKRILLPEKNIGFGTRLTRIPEGYELSAAASSIIKPSGGRGSMAVQMSRLLPVETDSWRWWNLLSRKLWGGENSEIYYRLLAGGWKFDWDGTLPTPETDSWWFEAGYQCSSWEPVGGGTGWRPTMIRGTWRPADVLLTPFAWDEYQREDIVPEEAVESGTEIPLTFRSDDAMGNLFTLGFEALDGVAFQFLSLEAFSDMAPGTFLQSSEDA